MEHEQRDVTTPVSSRLHSVSIPNSQRGRSNTDASVFSGYPQAFGDVADIPEHKAKLYQLFALIEKEFEALYVENYQLKLRLGQNPDTSLSELLKFQDNSSLLLNELTQKLSLSGKKASQQRQKWKLKGPPGRLVTSLKNNQGVDSTKNRCVSRCFREHMDTVFSVAACSTGTNNGRTVIGSASADQTARIFSPISGNCMLQYSGHSGAVNSISIRPDYTSPDQFTVLTASGDRTVHLWKTTPLCDLIPQPLPNSSEDDLDGTSEKLNELDDENFPSVPYLIRQPVRVYGGHSDAVVGAEWLMGGDQLVSVSWDRTANIYDVENDKVLNVLTGHEKELTFCSSHRTSKIVATASMDYTFRLWDFRETMRSVAVFQGHNETVNAVTFAAVHHIISSSDDRTVKIWDLRNMRCPIASSRFDSGVNKIGASAKHGLVAAPVDNRHVYILDLSGNRVGRLHRGDSHSSLITSAVWLDDVEAMNLVTSGIDRKIIGWKVNLSKN